MRPCSVTSSRSDRGGAKHMAEQPIRPEAAAVTDSGLFIRNATGLVRGMSQRASIILNFIPGIRRRRSRPCSSGTSSLPGRESVPRTALRAPDDALVLLRVRAPHGDHPALGRRLHDRQPRDRPAGGHHLVVLHDDGGPALERVLRHRVRDERARAELRRDRNGRASQEPDRLRHEDLDAPWLGVRALAPR